MRALDRDRDCTSTRLTASAARIGGKPAYRATSPQGLGCLPAWGDVYLRPSLNDDPLVRSSVGEFWGIGAIIGLSSFSIRRNN